MSKVKPEIVIAVPDGLSDKSRILWEAVVPRQIRSCGRQTLLEACLREMDSLGEIEAKLKSEGFTVTTGKTGAVHLHPLCRLLKGKQGFILKAWRLLGLNIETISARDFEPWPE